MSDSAQIYIRGFSRNTKEKDLQTLFEKFGKIKEARIINAYAFIVKYSLNIGILKLRFCKRGSQLNELI